MIPNWRRLLAATALLTSTTTVTATTDAAAPSNNDESILHSELASQQNSSLLWGPYRPNLYFGVRPRIPKSLMTGLMWGKVESFQDFQNTMRYTCEQNEGMKGYGWDEYDARNGGVQTIHDKGNGLTLTTSFVKVPGGRNGGNWGARVKGVLVDPEQRTTVILYVTQEGGGRLEAERGEEKRGYEGDVVLSGESEGLGGYKLVVTKGEGERPTSTHEISELEAWGEGGRTTVQSLQYPDEQIWQAKPIVFRQLKEQVDWLVENKYDNAEHAPPVWQVFTLQNRPGKGNVHIVQKVFKGDFEFDVLFSSESAGTELKSEDLTREIKAGSEEFGERFGGVFALKAPFNADKYKKFGRSMFSNLIGGIGYFYGQAVVDRSYAPEYDEVDEGFWEEAAEARARHAEALEGPHELFTSVPSRPFFPRGFLWDEGFHLLPIADWDTDLALEVIKSWFNLIDEDGWIGREQILGAEARSKVPQEFQTQYPHYANPPTLFLVVEQFVERLLNTNGTAAVHKERLSQSESLANASLENPEVGLDYLRKIYPLLRRQFQWFRKTQKGDIKSYDREAYSTKEAYRWRGRTTTHCLTSGLDDYPRPQPPHPGELHVDLMSWVGLMAKSLSNIGDALGFAEDVSEYRTILDAIEHNLVDLHWSETDGCFCDATIDDFEENKLVCHKGYISLFPFLTGLMKPDDPKVGRILALIGDEEELWTPYGLRSLSKKDALYETAENYWRSPIWININYMAVKQLHYVATQDGPHKEVARDLYSRLRKNLVETIYNAWEETGFAWEQYNPDTGKGQRTQHFTGWTSLVVKIMTMEDLEGGAKATGSEHGHDEL
ncbi:Processing alpha glucosidase I [Podospora pseudopauciseta]|uniref:Mannosyl-oligosaccharide glucosidase n=2 Tax=Podospora TaxID=5144 RepID=A0ABR0HNW5_9PEZI|nr:Processing alpha glucosidase I [Podospora pseudopauciseta]KAK4679648.1 Processing alpha glucosidase I [Podospora pseudoanserina]